MTEAASAHQGPHPENAPSGDNALTQVSNTARKAGSLSQLFGIPLAIVMSIALVWIVFGWLAHLGSGSAQLVRNLQQAGQANWQSALTLADLLRDSKHEELKRDPAVARELAGVLQSRLDLAEMDDQAIRLRVFLCRALGEFKTPEVLPALLLAAKQQRAPAETSVQRAAIEAISVYASNNDPARLRGHRALVDVLLAATWAEANDGQRDAAHSELRPAAAYALGILGGAEALDRLASLLGDSHSNTRYNAATGMCRHGDLRALPVLLEMLELENDRAADGEVRDSWQEWKRLLVLKNGIQAARLLGQQNSQARLDAVTAALAKIVASDLQRFPSNLRSRIHIDAEEALIEVQSRNRATST